MRYPSLVLLAGITIVGHLVVGAPPAHAQVQTKPELLCTEAMSRSLQKVTGTFGKEFCGCLKAGTQGKLPETIEHCLTDDAKSKIAKVQAKTDERFAKRCLGAGFPPFGVTDAATTNKAARAKEFNLFHDVFGPDLDAAIVTEVEDKPAAKCQLAIAKSLKKCQDTKLKAYAKCKKVGLKAAIDPIDSAADLEACLGADPKGTIAKACDLALLVKGRLKVDKIRKVLAQQCVDNGVGLAAAFPGCAADDPELAHGCLEAAVECRVCQAVNAADGLARDCDDFDDGLANGSCVDSLFIGPQQCAISGAFTADLAGGLFIGNALSGHMTFECGGVDPDTMEAPCACNLIDLDPVSIFGFGFACFRPVPGCGAGVADCDGGATRDLTMTTTHDIGACTGNADCAGQCAASCGGVPVFASACGGFCDGGPGADQPCLFDAQCPDARCNGLDGVPHGNRCACHCLDEASGGPATPGAIRCSLGVEISIEQALPCDGHDVVIPLGRDCMPFTTELTAGQILGANHDPNEIIPTFDNSLAGQSIACATLADGDLGAQSLVSTVNMLDAPLLGDASFQFQLGCQ